MEKPPGVFSVPAKHELLIYLDYGPPMAGLQVRYRYPFNAFQLSPERTVRIPQDRILRDVLSYVHILYQGLTARIPTPTSVRLPRAAIDPVPRPTGATIVIQDQRHPHQLPLAWLHYEEEGPAIDSRVENEVRMNPGDFTPDELSSWDRLRQRIKGIAWIHYQGGAVGEHLVR